MSKGSDLNRLGKAFERPTFGVLPAAPELLLGAEKMCGVLVDGVGEDGAAKLCPYLELLDG